MKKLFKNPNFYIISLLLLTGLALLSVFLFKGNGSAVTVTIDGEKYASYPLVIDAEYEIKTDGGENTLTIQDGRVCISSADCRNQLCVKSGWISKSGQSIICLPHSLVVEIEGGSTDVDAYSH